MELQSDFAPIRSQEIIHLVLLCGKVFHQSSSLKTLLSVAVYHSEGLSSCVAIIVKNKNYIKTIKII